MSTYYCCCVNESDRFTKEILKNFIERTDKLNLHDSDSINEPSIIFTNSNFEKIDLPKETIENAHIVVVSSEKTHIKSLFENKIADYIYKPDLSYDRFLKAIELIDKSMSRTLEVI